MKIFMFMFILWGGVLYCMGPLMIALAPSGLVGSYAGQYCRSLAEWALWPAMYSMFAMLMTAISSPDVNAIMSGSSTTSLPGSLDQPTVEMLLLALTSLVYGVCMLFVPFIAHFLIKGDFAGVAMGMMRAGKAASAAISGGMGAGASGFMMKETSSGAASTAGGGGHGILPPPRPGGGGGGAISSPASTGANVMNMPPPPTPSSTNMVPPATARA
jgi:hypothetical protein